MLGDFRSSGDNQAIADDANARWSLDAGSIARLKATHLKISEELAKAKLVKEITKTKPGTEKKNKKEKKDKKK